MRPLEIAILLLLAALLAGPLLPARPRWWRWLPFVTLLVLGAHVLAEGARWQMLPAYALAALFAILSLWRARRAPPAVPRRRWRAIGLGVLGVLMLLLAALPPVVFPVPDIPAPGGPYKVGTRVFDLVDPARDEIYTPAPNDKREIMVQVWYPAEPAAGARTGEWMGRIDMAGPAMAHYLHLPSFALDHAALVRTNSYPDAPLAGAQARYPVVIYSHGWNGFRAVNTNQMEALASHGYIAVGIDHSYGAMVTVFGDGRVAMNNPATLPDDAPPDVYQRASEVLEEVFAEDVQFVIGRLGAMNAGALAPDFAGRLDLERLGLFGHSTGGGAITLVCSRDPRCKAGLGMDAWLVPVPRTIIPGPLRQPFLFMRSEVWASAKNDARLAELYGGLAGPGYRMTIRGTKHYDFTLLPLLSPLAPTLGLKGPLDGDRTIQIITNYLLAFFDHHLKGMPAPLLDGPRAGYPEVVFARK